MVHYKEIQQMKIRLLRNLEIIDKEQQDGLEIFIRHKYLLNTDLNWFINEIRNSIIESLQITNQERKNLILTFRIRQVSTEHSILLIITLGIVSGFLGNLIYDLMKMGYKKLNERVNEEQVTIDTRNNIEQINVRPITIKENRIRYDDEKKQITIKRKDDLNPRWVRF